MKALFKLAIAASFIASVAVPQLAGAQQKTAKECRQEWQANKAANQAAGVTEKDYVTKCRSGTAAAQPSAAPAAAPASKAAAPAAEPSGSAKAKTAKACREEWQANKAAHQAAGVTEKDYVGKCRAGDTAAQPAAAPAAAAPAAPAPRATAPATPAPSAAAPAPTRPGPAAATPTGANQYSTEVQAKARCPRDTVVWVNLDSKIYHFSGNRNYGTTKDGAYMCEKDATGEAFTAAKNEKHP